MEFLEPLLLFLLECGGDLLLEAFLEFGIEGYQHARGRKNRSPFVAALGYLLLGAALGALWVWLAPNRLLQGRTLPGVSLILGPLAVGGVMEAWGRHRRAAGHATTNLATWYGGAAFALGIAIVRFFWVR